MLLKNQLPSDKDKVTTEEIHHAFHDALMGFFIKKVNDKNLADDLFQETLLKIHMHLDQLQDVRKVTAWIFQIARNVIRDYFRVKRLDYDTEKVEGLDQDQATVQENGSPSFMAMSGCIDDMLGALPAKYNEAIRVSELSDLNQKEAASELGISLPALKSRILRGRKALRELMSDCCKKSVSKNCGSKITKTSCGCQEYNEVI